MYIHRTFRNGCGAGGVNCQWKYVNARSMREIPALLYGCLFSLDAARQDTKRSARNTIQIPLQNKTDCWINNRIFYHMNYSIVSFGMICNVWFGHSDAAILMSCAFFYICTLYCIYNVYEHASIYIMVYICMYYSVQIMHSTSYTHTLRTDRKCKHFIAWSYKWGGCMWVEGMLYAIYIANIL